MRAKRIAPFPKPDAHATRQQATEEKGPARARGLASRAGLTSGPVSRPRLRYVTVHLHPQRKERDQHDESGWCHRLLLYFCLASRQGSGFSRTPRSEPLSPIRSPAAAGANQSPDLLCSAQTSACARFGRRTRTARRGDGEEWKASCVPRTTRMDKAKGPGPHERVVPCPFPGSPAWRLPQTQGPSGPPRGSCARMAWAPRRSKPSHSLGASVR